jgi:simple sugar transport system permease protein
MVLFFLLACDVLILYRPRLKLWARKPQLVSAKEEPAT